MVATYGLPEFFEKLRKKDQNPLPAMLRNLSAIALAQARRAGARQAGLKPNIPVFQL